MKAHELLGGPEKLSVNNYATDLAGHGVGVHDASACRWCVVGAVLRCHFSPEYTSDEVWCEDESELFHRLHDKMMDWISEQGWGHRSPEEFSDDDLVPFKEKRRMLVELEL